MSEFQEVEGGTTAAPDTAAYSSEFQRLAREERSGQAGRHPEDPDARHDANLGDGPAGQSETAPPSEAAPREPAPGENTNDIWANAPAHLREAFTATQTALEKAENAVRSNNGRASKAERDAAALRAQLLAQPAGKAPGTQPEAQQPDPALRERLVGDYEEIAPVVDEVLQLRQTVARLEASSASAAEVAQARNQLELQEFLAGEEKKLLEAHADWGDVVRDPGFVAWVQESPQFIRDGIARNAEGIVDGHEATKILDLYKVETGKVAADDPLVVRRRRQMEGSRTVPARVPGAPTATGTPSDYSSAWAALKAKDERNGRQRSRTN